jgi:predicted dehydrogenase
MLHLKRAEGLRNGGEPIRPLAVTGEVGDLTQVAGVNPENLEIATGWRDVENWGCAIIQFSDGARGVAYGSDNQLGGMESRLEINGSNAAIRCNLSPHDLVRAYAPNGEVFGDAYLQEKLDTGAGWSTPLPDEDWSSGQLAMCQAFADALQRGEPAEADGELGLDVIRVVYAAYASAAEGRRITLD